jgi:hypothetical protein
MIGHRRSSTKVLTVVCLIAFHCLLTIVARADFRILNRTDYQIDLLISGTITERDARALEALSPELERAVVWVWLDSAGGDVEAAMRIGRLIRRYEGATKIGKPGYTDNANCHSSCALVFISGVVRLIASQGGQLGLHRPYLASDPQSRQAVEKQVPLMLSQVRQYIVEMGITDNFYQQLVNTEPSQMAVYGDLNTEFGGFKMGLESTRVQRAREKRAGVLAR